SAGQDRKWSDPIKTLEIGDIVTAYLKGHGYVGIGKVEEKAVRVNEFRINNKLLNQFDIQTKRIYDNCDNEKTEFPVKVRWIKSVGRKNAKWKSNSGLFSTQLIKASLQGQPTTIDFLESEFDVNFSELMMEE